MRRQVFAFSGVLEPRPGERGNRPSLEHVLALVAAGELPAGYATEDGVGLPYVGTELAEVVTVRPGARAHELRPDGTGGCLERPRHARPI